jgi:predicted transcriptional regulator
MKILLSIRPEHVEKIISGEKKYEYRKSAFKNDIRKVLIYATKPIGKIIGKFNITKIISGSPEVVWKKTRARSGLSKRSYMKYFENKQTSYAFRISNFEMFEEYIDPNEVYPDFTAPQSFRYIE